MPTTPLEAVWDWIKNTRLKFAQNVPILQKEKGHADEIWISLGICPLPRSVEVSTLAKVLIKHWKWHFIKVALVGCQCSQLLGTYDTFYLENLLSLWSSIVNAAVTALLLAIMFLPERTLQCQILPPGRSQYQPGPMRAGSPSWPLHHTCPVLVGTKTSSKCSVIILGSASPLYPSLGYY